MVKSNRVVISVPANELRHADVPGSLFEADMLRRMPISDGLQRAYQVVSTLCKQSLCLVRPEIFGHGKARDWLDTRLGSVRNHICLSDGTAVKVIGGLENHLFFYEPGHRRASAGVHNLLTWAPETFTHIRTQINTFHAALLKGRLLQPPTTVSLPKSRFAGAPPEFYEFLLYPQCPAHGARFVIDKGPVANPLSKPFDELIYIPFTESSAHDPGFSKLVAQTIATAYFDPSQCVLVRLPALNDHILDLPSQILRAAEAIRDSAIVLPRVPAQNVFLVRSDLPESFFDDHARVSFLVDDTFEFWCYTSALYTKLHSVRYLLGGDRRKLPNVVQGLTTLLGRPRTGPGSIPARAPIVLTWDRDQAAMARKR